MTTTYRVLGDIEAVRTRPGMYVGDVSTPDHLATELLDNALDEVANGFATKINIFYNSDDNSFWCSDNGRGLEIGTVTLPDGTQEDSVKALCTYLHSGSKFDNVDYSQLIGMHGVGLVVVNSLSEWVVIKIRNRKDRTKIRTYTFKDSELVEMLEETDENIDQWSTIVGFKPNSQYFDSIEFNSRDFIERLILVQSLYGLDNFTFNGKEIPKLNFEQYVKEHLNLADDEQLYILEYEINKNHKIQIMLTYVESDDSIMIGNVNLRFCSGKFLTSVQTELKKSISKKLDKKFDKIADKEYLMGLRAFVLLNVPEPKFDSQTKTRMVLDVKDSLIDPLKSQIDWFIGQKDIIDTIESNLESKLHQKITNGGRSARSIKRVAVDKLRDCKNIPGDILYILEGDSADGTLKQIRDTNKEAIFPLKGKVLNVESATLEKIKNNKEIKDLITTLGSINNRRYNKIKIIADADLDGAHIVVLLLIALQKFAPDYIKSGNVYVVIPPLYGAEKSNKYFPIYNQSDIAKFEQNGYKITRFKGLGEMNPNQLEVCIRSGFEYQVKWPDSEDSLDSIISVVTNTEMKRLLMNNENVKMKIILDEVINNLKQKTK